MGLRGRERFLRLRLSAGVVGVGAVGAVRRREGGGWDLRRVGRLVQLGRGADVLRGRVKILHLAAIRPGGGGRRRNLRRSAHLRVRGRFVLGQMGLGERGVGLGRQRLVPWKPGRAALLKQGLARSLGVKLGLGGGTCHRRSAHICWKGNNKHTQQMTFFGLENVAKWPPFPLLTDWHRNKRQTEVISYLDFAPRRAAPRGHEQHVAPQKMKAWSELRRRRRRRRGGD